MNRDGQPISQSPTCAIISLKSETGLVLLFVFINLILYLYSAQYILVVQDSRHYLTHSNSTVHVLQLIEISLTGRHKDEF